MPTGGPLQIELRSDRHPADDSALAKALTAVLWGTPSSIDSSQARSFLGYWDSHCSLIDTQDALVKTHQDVLDIVAFVQENHTRSLDALREKILDLRPAWLGNTDDAAERGVEIAVRLSLFLEIDEWEPSMTLAEFIEECFPPSAPLTEETILSDTINVRNLEKIGGFHIFWTDCLVEHLSFDPIDKQLSLFSYSSFLTYYQNTGDRYTQIRPLEQSLAHFVIRELYPHGLLEETNQTLALLFPSTDIESKRWIRRARRKADLDLEMGRMKSSTRDLQQFPFWRDRLLLLRDAYDKAEPQDIKTWYFDKRNPYQRSTVLFAVVALILTVLFGLIQSVTGIIQVYLSYNANQG